MATRGRPPKFDREKVLQNAVEVFWSKGFAEASMAELSAAMKLNPPSIYAAFGSKEGLFRAALDQYVRTDGAGIWDNLDKADSAREAVEAVLRATACAYTRREQPRGCMIVLAAPQCEAHPSVCAELRDRRLSSVDLLVQHFEQAKQQGELPADLISEQLADYVSTVQHGMSIQAQDGASREKLLSVATTTMAGWDNAITACRANSHK